MQLGLLCYLTVFVNEQGYREDDGLHLESDADEQLLLYIPFTQVVKLYSFVIKGPEEEGNMFIHIKTTPFIELKTWSLKYAFLSQ